MTRITSLKQPLNLGDRGKAALQVERDLAKLGFAPGKVDGTYDAETAKAVEAFKAAHSDRFDAANGRLGTHGLRVVNSEIDSLSHGAYHARVKPSREHQRLDALTAESCKQARVDEATGEALHGVKLGDQGRAVLNIKRHLAAAGFEPGAGSAFDARTEAMVRQFQKKAGLPETGRVGAGTWKQLSKSFLYAKGAASPSQTVGEKSGAVKGTEKLLRDLGYKSVAADGVYDRATASAVRRFEKANDLKADGKLSEHDLKVLKAEAKVDDNARLKLVRDIAQMAKHYGVPAEIPLMTALVESNFKNVHYGDRDSLGMFQQRDAWGPASVRLNPLKSARMFLLGGQGGQPGAVDYIRRYRSLGQAAYGRWCQAVQVSAFPDRYQTRLHEARELLRAAGIKPGLARD